MPQRWLQIRGDPSIRQFLFDQSRVENEFDSHLNVVLGMAGLLLKTRGIFHAKVHFSSGQVTLWSMANPYNYQVYLKEEFLLRGFARGFEIEQYPINAKVPPDKIETIMAIFGKLRQSDESIYLRSASLNIINGTVGLNFSCDGSHYIDFEEFISRSKDTYV